MKPEFPNDRFPDPDRALDELFRVRDMAPDDFVQRTLAAARAKRRKARIYRFTAWSGGVAASLLLLLTLVFWNPEADSRFATPGRDLAPGPERASLASPHGTGERGAATFVTAEELTALLYASFATDDAHFYAHAQSWEDLLTDTTMLSDEALDFFLLLAEY